MLSNSPGGFGGATVLKLWTGATTIGSMLLASSGKQYLSDLKVNPHLIKWHQFSRLAINAAIPTTQSAIVVTSLLLYDFRSVERAIGSKKFAKLVAALFVGSTLLAPALQILLTSLFPSLDAKTAFPPGPYAMIFGLLTLYHEIIPASYYFDLTGLKLSDINLLDLLALPFLLWGGGGGLMKAFAGWVVARALILTAL